MKRKISKYIGNIIIGIGIFIVVSIAIYEAVNYPWNIVFEETAQSEDPETESSEYMDTSPAPKFPESKNPEIIFIPYQEGALIQSTYKTLISNGSPLFSEKKVPGTYIVLGSLKIPRINLSVNVLEGAESTQLGTGVGHIAGTAMPGEAGNCVIAGHRLLLAMHPFRHIDKLAGKDKIYIKFNGANYVYEVYKSFVVTPDDVWVLGRVEEEKNALTLITCETIYNPVNRLIVRAKLLG